MGEEAIEHHTEVRRTTRSVPAIVAVVATLLLAAVAVVVISGSDGDEPAEAAPSSTVPSSTTSTLPTRLPTVHIVADADDGPRPATTSTGPGTGGSDVFEAIQATPVVTDGRVVVLVDGGIVLAGSPGQGFQRVGPDTPSSALVASNEPAHVWVVGPEDELVLVDVDGLETTVRIPLGGDRVLGPATFGVVTASAQGDISWRRPSFDPTPVAVGGGSTPVDAGGDLVLVEGPPTPGGGRRFELWSVVDSSLVRSFGTSEATRPAVLATDGSTIALPHAAGWIVRDAVTGDQRGSLPVAPGTPVWVGDGRFALLLDGDVVLSDGRRLSPRWRVRDLAEVSP